MRKLYVFSSLVVLLAAFSAAADNRYSPPPFAPASTCPQATVQICGTVYTIPFGTPGALQSFQLSPKYVVDRANFQCVTEGFNTYYKLLNGDATDCAVKTCQSGDVAVCGIKIPVQAEAKFGEVVRVPLPDDIIDRSRVSSQPELSVQCAGDNDGTRYEAVAGAIPSCNVFRCQPTTLSACGASVVIENAVPMGTVLNTATQNNQSVTVQCLGSVDGAPHYAVTDYSCN